MSSYFRRPYSVVDTNPVMKFSSVSFSRLFSLFTCFLHTVVGFKISVWKLVFFSVTHFYQDLLSSFVLGHAVRMFACCRQYHPSVICTVTSPLLFHFAFKIIPICLFNLGFRQIKKSLLLKNTNIVEVRYEI
jgi:hypothetical protein